MPIYEYACTACGAECEILQRMSEDPERICPSCGAEALVKQVSAAGFRLKGGGWYETDFKSDGKRNLVGDEQSAKPAESKSDSTADQTKPAKSETASEKSSKPSGVAETKNKSVSPAAKPSKSTPAAPTRT